MSDRISKATTSSLASDARTLLDACGVARSNSWISRTVRVFLDSAVHSIPFGMFLAARVELNERQRRIVAERADLRYLLTYADPVGEAAVRNIMRAGAHA